MNDASHKPPIVLVIAGNDPSGGAGLAADQQAVTALGCHPAPVVTTLTVQDTRNAYALHTAPPDFVAGQVRVVLEDMPVAAIKIGLLGSGEIGEAVADVLSRHQGIPIVLDPVLVAAGGAKLAEENLHQVLKDRLMPMATVLTPNADESRILGSGDADPDGRARQLRRSGSEYVLIKGADEETEDVENILYGPNGLREAVSWPRLEGVHHGSGCTLASAIGARLAQGDGPVDAVLQAQDYTWRALKAGWKLGRGQWIPNRQLRNRE